MNIANHIPEDDLALFALALLSPQEAAFITAHLTECDLCRSEVARLQGDLVGFAMTIDMQAPPAAARDRLLAAVAKEQKFVAPSLANRVSGSSGGSSVGSSVGTSEDELLDPSGRYAQPVSRGMGLFGWAGWALAAGLAAVTGWQFYQGEDLHRQIATQTAALEQAHHVENTSGDAARAQEILQTLTDPTAMQVALHLPVTGATPKPEAHAAYIAERGNLVFIASHLKPIGPNKTYELWLLPASGTAPVAAGLFRPDENGNASVLLPTLPKNIAAKGFGVTVENEGGSKAPTPPIVLAGT